MRFFAVFAALAAAVSGAGFEETLDQCGVYITVHKAAKNSGDKYGKSLLFYKNERFAYVDEFDEEDEDEQINHSSNVVFFTSEFAQYAEPCDAQGIEDFYVMDEFWEALLKRKIEKFPDMTYDEDTILPWRCEVYELEKGKGVLYVDPDTGKWLGGQSPHFDYLIKTDPFVPLQMLLSTNFSLSRRHFFIY